MDRLIIAFAREDVRARVAMELSRCGYLSPVVCAGGMEALRASRRMGGGIVLCGPKLPDMTADQLAEDLGDEAVVLAVGGGDALSLCKHRALFTLRTPFTPGALSAALSMLTQLEAQKRGKAREKNLTVVKRRLMEDHGLTETQAHRAVQKFAMDTGRTMSEAALELLRRVTASENGAL